MGSVAYNGKIKLGDQFSPAPTRTLHPLVAAEQAVARNDNARGTNPTAHLEAAARDTLQKAPSRWR
eukprot:7533568-Lingulodinium_polyedra.AAC.1